MTIKEISQCVTCSKCEKYGFGEDYFCRAMQWYVESTEIIKNCHFYEHGEVPTVYVGKKRRVVK